MTKYLLVLIQTIIPASTSTLPVTFRYLNEDVILNHLSFDCYLNKSTPSKDQIFFDDSSIDIPLANFHVAINDCFEELEYATSNKRKVTERKIHSPQRNNIPLLSDSTYWVDDYMAVGHAMYDISLLQLLRISRSNMNFKRIVLQIAPCATNDLCLGIGTWESFFRQLYSIMLLSAYRKSEQVVPIYIRFNKVDKDFHPHVVDRNISLLTRTNSIVGLEVKESYCFERFITRKCKDCFWNSLSKEAVVDFKLTAYSSLFSPNVSIQVLRQFFQMKCIHKKDIIHIPNILKLFRDTPRIVTVVLRAQNIRRYIKNSNLLLQSLNDAILLRSVSSPTTDPSANVTTSSTRLSRPHVVIKTVELNQSVLTAADQMRVVVESDVVIAGHGAFLSNLVYMRPGTLLIEIIGDVDPCETVNFMKLSEMFLVKHVTVMAQDLRDSDQMSYSLSQNESAVVAELVRSHLFPLMSPH